MTGRQKKKKKARQAACRPQAGLAAHQRSFPGDGSRPGSAFPSSANGSFDPCRRIAGGREQRARKRRERSEEERIPWGPMGALRGALGTAALCLAAACALHPPGGVSLVIPQHNINATVAQNILLSVEYSCRGVATVEWKHVSSWGTTKIVEWKSGNYVNISTVYKDRVTTFENGSIQLLNVGMRDAGYYFITVTEEYGTNTYGTIIVNVYEIIYEDLHFVAVLFAFLAAVAAILICFMWLCNKSLHLFQKKTTHELTASTTEEIELETIEC
ncbi:V-set and transmembrane domain-containing protein 5 [Cuculus canorus]|uniref:V-set and transmembrane domain-containing protein 5 n=1 Tax=Cuculus canorus TaxID=55661 RepID=UPI0023AA7027|nr:V-set and transmembrane domain-containing protein 5 [Cuculus canorus]